MSFAIHVKEKFGGRSKNAIKIFHFFYFIKSFLNTKYSNQQKHYT